MMEKNTMRRKMLSILQDGQWHGCADLLHLGLSYRNCVSELRAEGYVIDGEKERGKATFRYRLVGKEVDEGLPIIEPKPPESPAPAPQIPQKKPQQKLF